VDKTTYGPGIGKNKKEAEQQAANIAYDTLIARRAQNQGQRTGGRPRSRSRGRLAQPRQDGRA
jgi:hypothetical protein